MTLQGQQVFGIETLSVQEMDFLGAREREAWIYKNAKMRTEPPSLCIPVMGNSKLL